ncbi:FecCD family ABC transporter permease [Celerinatantimonas sp. YJH-8]|uniref:FecCD family ABC transporter permease n=1 Tax=Celerinatantimonas sp. YJH-8 TaxID=3228714 RepID=UPI0038C96221
MALIIMLLSLGMGDFSLSAIQTLQILLHPHLHSAAEPMSIAQQVIWQIRLPRILMAFLAGAGLAVCGAVLQGVFHNPLVGPHLIGVSSGSAFGGTLAILWGWSDGLLLASSFLFGMLALLLIFIVASLFSRRSRLVLILAGVILSGFFGALVSLMQYLADTEEKLPRIVYWLLGSFATAHWQSLVGLAIPLGISGALLMALRWRLNVLSMGEQDAQLLDRHAGVVRWLLLVFSAVIVAAQVAYSGSIGWIGLVIPHMARLWVGTDHRVMLPASLWIGGCFMMLVDDLARCLSSSEIPIGILTALLGAPLIAVLLYINRDKERL